MSTTRIKICGITREADAIAAAEAGADAIGLVFYPPSSRYVELEQAAAIVEAVAPFVTVVGLFVDAPAKQIEETLSAVPLDTLQFQGGELQRECSRYQRPWMKAIQVRRTSDVTEACAVFTGARAILLDTWHEGKAGGTGVAFDWSLAPEQRDMPLVLAGGLNADNVGAAMRAVHPAAVDVSSSVESAPGIKDAHQIKRFVDAVRATDRAMSGTNDEQ